MASINYVTFRHRGRGLSVAMVNRFQGTSGSQSRAEAKLNSRNIICHSAAVLRKYLSNEICSFSYTLIVAENHMQFLTG
jgi:hypothetical protein